MQINQANESLFTLDIAPLKEVATKLLSFKYNEFISSTDSLELQLHVCSPVSSDQILHQPFHLSWDWEGIEQHAHGVVKSVKSKPDGRLTLVCESPLLTLKQVRLSRHFTYQNLQSIVKEVLTGAKVNLKEIQFKINGSDSERDYTAQHEETNLSFLERILHETAWTYYLTHAKDGVNFCVTDHSGGYHCLSNPVSFQPLDQGTKSIQSIFDISRSRDSDDLIHAKSDCLGLRAGQIFSLMGHPDQYFNQSYLILSISHEMDEHSSGLRYQNSLKLLPAHQHFIPEYSEPERRINTLSCAKIHSESDAPHLTEQGTYLLTSPHTGALTHPVRLATPYAGLNHGLHFPLHDNTQVLVAYLNGHPDQPVVLGALYNDEQPSLVTSENARQNLLVTQSGHTLLMDDTPGVQKIHLHTANQENRLLLDASEGANQLNLVSEQGDFKSTISQGTEFSTENNLQLTAGQSIIFKAKQDCSFFSDEANFKSESAQDHQLIAGKDLSLHSDKDLLIRVDENSHTTVKGSMRTDIEAGDYQLKLAAGCLSHEAQKNLQFSTATGDLVLKTAGASVTFQANGNIVFSAKKIILDAGNIDIHNAGEGMGN